MNEFDLILGFGAIIYGIFLFLGKCRIIKDPKARREYDEKKMGTALGIVVVLMGIATLINGAFPSMAMSIGYVVFILADFVAGAVYTRKCCKKVKK